MKKLLFSAAIVMGTIGICIANSGKKFSANSISHRTNVIVKDTVPGDTTKPKTDTSFTRLK